MMKVASLISLLLASVVQAQEINLVPVIEFPFINLELTLVSTPVALAGLQANPTPFLPLTITPGPLATSNSLQVTAGAVSFLIFSLQAQSVPAGSSGVLAVITYGIESAGIEVCPLQDLSLSDPFGGNINSLFMFEPCIILPEIPSPPPPSPPAPIGSSPPPVSAQATCTLRLSSVPGFESNYAVDLFLTIELPIAGIQFNYDLDGADKLLPNQAVAGQVILDKGYSFSEGPFGVLAFSFQLILILPEENPEQEFVAVTYVFNDPVAVVDRQLCIDDGVNDSVVSGLMGIALPLAFPMGTCITLPAVAVDLVVSGLSLTIRIRSFAIILGSQFELSGPDGFSVVGASNSPLLSGVGFENPSFGPSLVLSFSLSGLMIPPQAEFVDFIDIEFNIPGNYCVSFDDTEFAGSSGTELSFGFIDGMNCFVLEVDPCPTAGTGDVNLDGDINIQDIVEIIPVVLGTGGGALDECQLLTADVSSDGEVSVSDIVLLIGIITGQN